MGHEAEATQDTWGGFARPSNPHTNSLHKSLNKGANDLPLKTHQGPKCCCPAASLHPNVRLCQRVFTHPPPRNTHEPWGLVWGALLSRELRFGQPPLG